MRADQILSERPAPVAPLPPWGIPKSVTFSMARSVIFSMAIDSVRLRTRATKRFKRFESATGLICELLTVAEKRLRKLNAPHLLEDVFEGRKFEDGKPVSTHQRAATA